jgi:thiol:disulfide interchange protein DsbD
MNFIVSLILLFVSFKASAAPSSFAFPEGSVEVVASHPTWNKKQSLSLGLHFKLKDEWHIYWKNSGDSGAAPKWQWIVTNSAVIKEHWPVPHRMPIEGLINFGYDKEALYKFDLENDQPDTITANVKLEFLICKVECIPHITELEIVVPFAEADTPENSLFTKFVYPTPPPAGIRWKIEKREGDDLVTRLRLPSDLSAQIKNLEIFPEDGESFKTQNPVIDVNSDYHVRLALQDTSKTIFAGSQFLAVIQNQDGEISAHTLELTRESGPGFAKILLWALIGGLILNIMPCVFPVLSIKILSFLGPEKNSKHLKASGLLYTLGVVVSFLALGGLLLFLRASGEQLGWGFQLQSPFVASAIAILFFWLGFNFLGTFEIGQSLTYLGSKKTSNSLWGSFLTGVLATIVATPCTAPFMGAAIGASLTLPASLTLIVFAGLGLGMALPFLLLAFFPQALRFLPKPGAWMKRFKQFLAFPLFATVLWLLWVLAQQSGSDGMLYLLTIFVCIGLWIWIAQQLKNEKWKQFFLLLGFVLSVVAIKFLPETDSSQTKATATSAWNNFNEASIQTDIKSGQAVFIDFTAAWCITCQVNKKLVLNTEEIQTVFAQNKVKLYKADWTDKNPIITQALARFGRNSLPLYVYYSPGKTSPTLLPEILTKSMIYDLFNKEKNP